MKFSHPKIIEQIRLGTLPSKDSAIVTNGCFDLFGPHHAQFLSFLGRSSGHFPLIVGVNSDSSVKTLKGEQRPILDARARAYMVACHEAVDHVFIFNQPDFRKSLNFMRLNYNELWWAKGGDYTANSLNPKEREMVDGSANIKMLFAPRFEYPSTSDIIRKIKHENIC
jgi:bifunctional ADP-heptose synthase (sugar kinase/adenylyltransferase)